jgi:hypothetical protein
MLFAGQTSASPATGPPMFAQFLTSSMAASRAWSSTATCSKRRLGETAYSTSGSALLPSMEGASLERPEPRPLQARTARVAAGVETQGASKVRALVLARFSSTRPSDFRPPRTKSAGLCKNQIGNDSFLRIPTGWNRREADISFGGRERRGWADWRRSALRQRNQKTGRSSGGSIWPIAACPLSGINARKRTSTNARQSLSNAKPDLRRLGAPKIRSEQFSERKITRPADAPVALKPGRWPKARAASYNRRSPRRKRSYHPAQ